MADTIFDDDDDDDDFDAAIARATTNRFAGRKEAPIVNVDKAINRAVKTGKTQRYPDFFSPNVQLPYLRPKNQVPQVEEAFAWAYPDLGLNKKGKPKKPNAKRDANVLGLSKKQQRKAVAIPGLTPILDFMSVYLASEGGRKGKK